MEFFITHHILTSNKHLTSPELLFFLSCCNNILNNLRSSKRNNKTIFLLIKNKLHKNRIKIHVFLHLLNFYWFLCTCKLTDYEPTQHEAIE